MTKTTLHRLGFLFGAAMFVFAVWVIHREMKEHTYEEIVLQIGGIPTQRLVMALGLTFLSYLLLIGYDALAFRYIQNSLPLHKIAATSFIGYAFNYNVGLANLAGSSIRLRLYTAWGVPALDVAKVIGFCAATFWMGFLTLGGIVFSIEPLVIPFAPHVPLATVRPLGPVFLAVIASYVGWLLWRRTPIKLRNWELPLPSPSITLLQVGVASLDWVLAGTVLYVLLPPQTEISYPGMIGVYLLAQIIGMLSHVPGGLGILEAVVIFFLCPPLEAGAVVGSLVVYRVIYYLIPLGNAAVLLGLIETFGNRRRVKRPA